MIRVNEPVTLCVLPVAAATIGNDVVLAEWLARGRMTRVAPPGELLSPTLDLLDVDTPVAALGAARHVADKGMRDDIWIAAADPVHLEARMRDVRVRAFPDSAISASDVAEIFASLEEILGKDSDYAFTSCDRNGYLLSNTPLALPNVAPEFAEGNVPDKFQDTSVSDSNFHRLIGELQMLLHEHPVNLRRSGAGQPAINSLWLWGGGRLQKSVSARLPRLYADDSLFRGYWMHEGAPVTAYAHAIDRVDPGHNAVVVVPRRLASADCRSALLDELRAIRARYLAGQVRHLAVLFADGTVVNLRYADRWKFWRGANKAFEKPQNG